MLTIAFVGLLFLPLLATAPHIDSINPPGAKAGSDVFITLQGSSFGTSGEVFVGDLPCSFASGTHTHNKMVRISGRIC